MMSLRPLATHLPSLMAGSWRSSSRPSSSSLIPEIQRCHGKNLSLIQEQKEQKERKKERRKKKKEVEEERNDWWFFHQLFSLFFWSHRDCRLISSENTEIDDVSLVPVVPHGIIIVHPGEGFVDQGAVSFFSYWVSFFRFFAPPALVCVGSFWRKKKGEEMKWLL